MKTGWYQIYFLRNDKRKDYKVIKERKDILRINQEYLAELSEGTNRVFQSKQLRIDENDFFGLLLATARYDTIGAITV